MSLFTTRSSILVRQTGLPSIRFLIADLFLVLVSFLSHAFEVTSLYEAYQAVSALGPNSDCTDWLGLAGDLEALHSLDPVLQMAFDAAAIPALTSIVVPAEHHVHHFIQLETVAY